MPAEAEPSSAAATMTEVVFILKADSSSSRQNLEKELQIKRRKIKVEMGFPSSTVDGGDGCRMGDVRWRS
jgi:hypothetical protein